MPPAGGPSTATPTAPCTVISASVVEVRTDGVRLRQGQLRAQQQPPRDGWTRIGLLATTALLLGGDEVDLEVTVGPGARLDLYDVAGTVAYHGRGAAAAWRLQISIAEGGSLRYRGQPFVVSDGADVRRSTTLDLAGSATLWLRETVVLGRSGQRGGRLRTRTRLRVADRPVWVEDQDLDAETGRGRPGMLGDRRILDSILTVGPVRIENPVDEGAVRYALVDGFGSVIRYLGTELAASPLHRVRP